MAKKTPTFGHLVHRLAARRGKKKVRDAKGLAAYILRKIAAKNRGVARKAAATRRKRR